MGGVPHGSAVGTASVGASAVGTPAGGSRSATRRNAVREDLTESLDERAWEQLRSKLIDLAWFRYRIPRDRAEDVFQSAVAAYLEGRANYADVPDAQALLAGFFRNKCLEHIDRSVRESRRLRTYCASADAARANPWIRPGGSGETRSVVEDLVRDEDRRWILRALERLRPISRELVTLIDRDELDRKGLIERLKLNKNTLDSRLHACRRELRALLRRAGVGA
jgi:DNA-directed RNA polymerase specialized sigma24 family protein